jgi:hypothetical protein
MHWGTKAFVSATPFERSSHIKERLLLRQTTQYLKKFSPKKKGLFSPSIFE